MIGLALGVAFARGLDLGSPNALVAGALGALAGFVVGLVAGRPIWARDAKTEAFLKACSGAALGGFGLSFALRRWLKLELDLSAFSLGVGPAGQLSAVVLPAVSTALSLFFELDDDGSRTSAQVAARSRGETTSRGRALGFRATGRGRALGGRGRRASSRSADVADRSDILVAGERLGAFVVRALPTPAIAQRPFAVARLRWPVPVRDARRPLAAQRHVRPRPGARARSVRARSRSRSTTDRIR